ncbi:MAG: hypothetical protein DWQ10_08540 [Calditrichaeota bacterium]|nr:MAG: hypothetical protein DWQ10_08540 [Calditrichota bacterium]
MQNQNTSLFVGLKISEKLQDLLDASNASVKPFFKEKNPAYLQILQINNEQYIGKVTTGSTSLENLSNMLMNVKTMIKMICPMFVLTEEAIKVFAVAPKQVQSYRY